METIQKETRNRTWDGFTNLILTGGLTGATSFFSHSPLADQYQESGHYAPLKGLRAQSICYYFSICWLYLIPSLLFPLTEQGGNYSRLLLNLFFSSIWLFFFLSLRVFVIGLCWYAPPCLFVWVLFAVSWNCTLSAIVCGLFGFGRECFASADNTLRRACTVHLFLLTVFVLYWFSCLRWAKSSSLAEEDNWWLLVEVNLESKIKLKAIVHIFWIRVLWKGN